MKVWMLAAGCLLGVCEAMAAANAVYSADGTVTAPLVLSGAYEISVATGKRVTYAGVISGSGPLKVTGGGTLVLQGANTYTGGTTLESGYLCASNDTALGTGPLTICGQTESYAGPCELDVMGAGPGDATVRTIANPIRVTGDTTPRYPGLMAFGQNSVLTGKITAAKDFYFYDDIQSTTAISSSQYNRYQKVLGLTFGEIDCGGTLGNRGLVRFVFGGKVKAPFFDLLFTRPIQRPGDFEINNNCHSAFVFTVPSEVGRISTYGHHVYCACANALPGMVWQQTGLPNGYEGSSYLYAFKYGTSTYFDQTFAALVSDEKHDTGTKLGWAVECGGSKTVTLTGIPLESGEKTKETVGSIRLLGKMNLVLDAYDGYTQTFLNRNHTLSGTITVKKGTLRVAGLGTFSNATSVAVAQGAALRLDSSVRGAFAGLKTLGVQGTFDASAADAECLNPSGALALELGAGAVLSLPEATTLKVKSYKVGGTAKAPGIYCGSPSSPLRSGMVICLDAKGQMPVVGDLTGGQTVTEDFTSLGDRTWTLKAGERLTFDNSLRLVQGTVTVVSPKDTSNPARVILRGTNVVDGAIVSTSAVFEVSGLVATPRHESQGNAANRGASTLTIDGYPGGAYLSLSNAVVEKPVYLHYSGFGAIRTASGTTNVIRGHVAWPTPWPGFTVAKNSELVFEGGFKSGHTLRSNGDGTIRVRRTPVTATTSVGWNLAAGRLSLETPGNKFSFLCTGHQNGNTSALELGVSYAFDTSATAALMNGYQWSDSYGGLKELTSGSGTIDLKSTVQSVNTLCGSVLSTIRGEAGARIEILRQVPVSGYLKDADLHFSSKIEGEVSLVMRGAGTLRFTNRVFETTGSLRIEAGAVDIAKGSVWRGTGGVDVRGSGRLVLHDSGQLHPDTRLRLYDEAVVEIPAGATLSVKELDVWDGAGWVKYAVQTALSAATLPGRITGGGTLSVSGTGGGSAAGDGVEFPLEWNETYDTSVPYEVEIDTEKLLTLAGVPRQTGFEVFATVGGERRQLGLSCFEGKRPGRVALRFAVPAGTTALACRAGVGVLELEDASLTGNLFAGALSAGAAWTVPSNALRENRADGILFSSKTDSSSGYYVDYTAGVPTAWRGKPVRLEIDVTSESALSWGGYVKLWQYDADGNRLPESVSDIRWTSHMRPPGTRGEYRENGRIHPQAAKVVAKFEVRGAGTSFDNYGLPLANREDGRAHLLLSRLVLRQAAELPFPKYDDRCFPAGVTGRPGDAALALGGTDHNGFFYATHSHAAWAENVELPHESQKFFPTGDGTVEAWFRPDSWPTKAVYLFLGFQGYSAKKSASGRSELMSLKYLQSKKQLTFSLKDRTNGVFTCTLAGELPVGQWSHVAAAWSEKGGASVFLNGRRLGGMSIAGYKPVDTETEKYANEEMVTEFFLGCHSSSARNTETAENSSYPFFQGAVDQLRVSTGARYSNDFTPSKSFAADAATRALFAFDRSFDGTSGGDYDFIRGSFRSFSDRVDHGLKVKVEGEGEGRIVQYYPLEILPESDHRKVLDIDNYPVMPTVAEFLSARTARTQSFDVAPGGSFTLDVPATVYRDFVEIANTGKESLVYPIVLNEGEIDPRSFGDIRDTLGVATLSPRDCANRIFQFVLGASDYFMNHTAFFTPGTDTPGDVEYQALTMLNGYCGFECGPLNSMTKNIFTCSGYLLSSQTGGYGHSFEQVFYDGKNHIYDLSAQKFFPAFDNETASYLQEAGDQPGLFHRIGANPDHFIRKASRGPDASSPSYREKVAMNLNPGERIRVWFDNDGEINDLQCAKSQVNDSTDLYKENYDAKCFATAGSAGSVWRVHRFFPHAANGFLVYEGAVDRASPAFAASTDQTAVYEVKSCYPVVAGEYSAKLKTGQFAQMQISTDRGTTWRNLPAGRLRYEVRARTEYLVRALAKPSDVVRFSASTEVQVNARIYTGRLHGGRNALTLKANGGDAARVTLGWREPAKAIEIKGGVYSGTIPGAERQLVLIDPSEPRTFEVSGASAAATVRPYGGLSARLENGLLTLAAGTMTRGFAAVDIEDEGAVKQLTVLVSAGARLLTPGDGLTPSGTAKVLNADADRVQPCLEFVNTASVATGSFAELPAGKYVVMGLDRFESHPPAVGSPSVQVTLDAAENGKKAVTLCYPANGSCNYLKANYGKAGVSRRANFKWGYPQSELGNNYYSSQMRVFDVTRPFSSLKLQSVNTWTNGVELAAVLVVPCDRAGETEELYCDLIKLLCGLNCQPWRVTSGTAARQGELALRPTFCSCSVSWERDEPIDGLAIEYRPAGSAGAWSRAPRFPYFRAQGEHRGSILDLTEDTAYEVRLVSPGGAVWAEGAFRTWKSDVPVARTVTLDPKTVKFPVEVSDQGAPDGWVRYVLPAGTALTNASDSASTFRVRNAAYVLFDDLRLVGGARYVFDLANSTGVRIRNCDVSGWGRVGVPRYDVAEGGKRYLTPTTKSAINMDGAIHVGTGMKETVIERCYVHDPRGRANSWYYSHPAGPEAVVMGRPDHSTVIRWNDFCGGVEHRYNDVVEGEGNFYDDGGFNRDADVYGNYMGFSNDDAIELDGGQRNVRCFDNRFEYNYCGVSIQGCMMSPVYVHRNAFTGMCDEFDLAGQAIKTSTNTTGVDVVSYLWDNLLWGGASGFSYNGSYPWIVELTGNTFGSGGTVANAAKGISGCVFEPNAFETVTEAQIDPAVPKRPLPFVLDRARISGVKVAAGCVEAAPAGKVDVGAAVFRFSGSRPAVSRFPFVSTLPTSASTNRVQVFDLRRDVTFAADVASGPLPFVKTGPGAMTLLGASDAASFKFGTTQPGSGYPSPAGEQDRFVLPADGTLPTAGFGFFALLDGRLALERGAMTVRASTARAFIGGWTAGEGEAEKDVFLEQNGGTMTIASRCYVGQRHGFANFNTPNGPAKAYVTVNGGRFMPGGGYAFTLGSYSSAPSGKTLNTDIRLTVGTNGLFTMGTSYGGLRLSPLTGQSVAVAVDGGRLESRLVHTGLSGATDATPISIDVANGGTFWCEALTNNASAHSQTPRVSLTVRDGGMFLTDDFANRRGQVDVLVDGGILGDADVNGKLARVRRHLVAEGCSSLRIGPKGMTVRATGSCGGKPVTCVIGTPITSAAGPIRIEAAPGNTVEFADGSVFDGALTVTGGRLRVPAGMTVTMNDISGLEALELDGTLRLDVAADAVLSCPVSGRGTLVKSGAGELRVAARIEADVLEAREGMIVVETPFNAVRLVRFVRGNVKLAANEALSLAQLEWTDPTAALETCATFDMNGHVNSNDCLRSVAPADPDGRFWIKNGGSTVTWTIVNREPGTNVAFVGLDRNVRPDIRRATVSGTRGTQILSNLTVRATTATFACQNYVVAGDVHFPNVTTLQMHSGAATSFEFGNESPDAFPSLRKLTIDSHTLTLNDRALACFHAIRRRFSLQSNKVSSFVLPEGSRWTVATWIERGVSPAVNVPKGTYDPAYYKSVYTGRSLKPASARIRVLSSGPGEVVLPDPFKIFIK